MAMDFAAAIDENMATDWADRTHKEDLAAGAIDHIEKAARRLTQKAEPARNGKLVIEGYEEKQSIQVAGRLIILAENPKADKPYLVCCCKWDNPLCISEYYNARVTDDYVEALNLYANGILSFTQILEKEMADCKQPLNVLTAADCIPKGLENDLVGRLIVIKPDVLAPEYRRSEHQLKHCMGGFGASPNSRGNAVFCKDLYSGKESRYERYDVAGVVDPAKLPEWARLKLSPPEKAKPIQKPQSSQSKQPPSLLDEAREAAQLVERRKAERGNAPATKKKDGPEV